jgi:hypothetical protein
VDGYIYTRNKTLKTFIVSCPKGTMFLKSVDASNKIKCAQLLCDLMEEVVPEVSEQHIQIVRDTVAN